MSRAELDEIDLLRAQLATMFTLETLVHSRDRQLLTNFVQFLQARFSASPAACEWFVEVLYRSNWSRKMFLLCTVSEARQAALQLIVHVLSCVRASHIDRYCDEEKPSTVALFFRRHLDLLPEAHQHWHHFSHYFQLLYEFALLGPPEREFLLRCDVVPRLVEFYVGEDFPVPRSNTRPKRNRLGDKLTPPNLGYMGGVLSVLVQGCHTEASTTPPNRLEGALLQMPTDSRRMLLNGTFLTRLIADAVNAQNTQFTSEMLTHFSWESLSQSTFILDIVMQKSALLALTSLAHICAAANSTVPPP